jgi:starch synthase
MQKKPLDKTPQTSSNNPSLNILIVASEMYPFAKVGGMADVVASLAAALKRRGHDVRVVMPRYGMIDLVRCNATIGVEPMGVWMGTTEEWCSVLQAQGPGDVPVYLIEHRLFFERHGLYHDGRVASVNLLFKIPVCHCSLNSAYAIFET